METFEALADGKQINDDLIQQWTIARRPDGNVRPEDFAWSEVELPKLAPNQVLLKTVKDFAFADGGCGGTASAGFTSTGFGAGGGSTFAIGIAFFGSSTW